MDIFEFAERVLARPLNKWEKLIFKNMQDKKDLGSEILIMPRGSCKYALSNLILINTLLNNLKVEDIIDIPSETGDDVLRIDDKIIKKGEIIL